MRTSEKDNLNITRQEGLSLIELMIALALGVLVLFAILQVFTASLQGVNLQNAFSRVQENGRMSIQLISRDIRAADFWGCLRDTSLITNHLDPSDPDYDAALMPVGQQGVIGEDNVSSKTIQSITVKDATDVLTLRGSTGIADIKIVPPFMALTAAELNIINSSELMAGDIILLGDCLGGELFTLTEITADHLLHNTGTIAGGVQNLIENISHSYESSAQIMHPYVKTYFIGENKAAGYSLYKNDNGIIKELVRGVNDLQLVYGEDTNNNGSVDTFSVASAVTNMSMVRSIHVVLISESGDASSASALEKTYAVTVNIRNRTLQ